MKFSIILFSVSFFLITGIYSQTADSVSLGANYTNQVHYSLENGIESDLPKNDWDIAFETTPQGYSILINSAIGTELYLYPGDTSDFATLDTAGMTTWTQRFNSDTSWTWGAFAQDQTGFDVGWGTYDLITHNIIGDRIFVIKLSNGMYQKIWIQSLIGGVYTFRHASIVGSMDMTHTMDRQNFSNKRFGYYSLQNHSHLNKEPDASEWDLFFGQFISFIPDPYLVSGVLHKGGMRASQAYPVNDPSTYVDFSAHSFGYEINTLGSDWKTFNMMTFQYEIADSTVYFVQKINGDIWKVVFTGFGGSSNGTFYFTKELLFTSGVEDHKAIKFFEIYPNPASSQVSVNYSADSEATLRITDLSGKLISQKLIQNGSMQHTLDVSNFQTGIYLISIQTETESITKKLIIQ